MTDDAAERLKMPLEEEGSDAVVRIRESKIEDG